MAPLDELDRAFTRFRRDRRFRAELDELLRTYAGRPTPLTVADRLAERLGGARIALKREDLLHTGAHKLNNALGQVLLARRMGKERVVAETGAGQHGVATAAAAAKLGVACRVYMGVTDMARQAPNVSRMRLLGAEVVGVDAGSKTLKDAINEAMRDWTENVASTHYVLGSALGPHPYPTMVREFQAVIGREARRQFRRLAGRDPHAVVACVGGGSNAIGIFSAFLRSRSALYGVEAGGRGAGPGDHAARFSGGSVGVLHGTRTMLLQDAARADPLDALDLGRSRLPGRRARARRAPRRAARRLHQGVGRRRRSMPSGCFARPRASFRPSSPPTRSRSPRASRASGVARGGFWSTSPAAATRTSTRSCAPVAGEANEMSRLRDAFDARPRRGPRRLRRVPDRGRSHGRAPRSISQKRSSARAPTCSSSAFRSRTRSPTARCSSGRGLRALAAGTTLETVFDIAQRIRRRDRVWLSSSSPT